MVLRAALALLVCALAVPAGADEATDSTDFAIVGARVVTAAGDDVVDGVVLVQKGRIEAVGARADVVIPNGVETIDASGKVVMPAFVHVASRIGLRGNGGGNANTTAPDRTPEIDIDPWNAANRWAAGNGYATLGLLPGSGIVGGEGVAVRTATDDFVAMLRNEHALLRVDVEVGSRFSSTLAGKLAESRKELDATKQWKKDHAKWEVDKAEWEKAKAAAEQAKKPAPKEPPEPKEPKPKDDNAPFRRVLEGETALFCNVGDAAEVAPLTAALADERVRGEKLRLYVAISGDAYVAAPELADLGAVCIVRAGLSTWTGTDHVFCPAVHLANAGLRVILLPTNDGREGLGSLRYHLAITAAAGLGTSEALRAVTAAPAELLGLADECGTLEKGRRADLLLFSGDPLLATSRLERIWIDGQPVKETP